MNARQAVLAIVALIGSAFGCAETTPPAASPPPTQAPIAWSISPSTAPAAVASPQPAASAPAAAPPAAPIDPARVASMTGGKPAAADDTANGSFPPDHSPIEVGAPQTMPPSMR